MKLTKNNVINMLARAGTQPAYRGVHQGYDIYIADGRTDKPEWVLRRFGVEPGDFPNGCFTTFWFVAEGERFLVGQMLPFDIFHDPQYDEQSKHTARVAGALVQARNFIDSRMVAASQGNLLHA
jgi:hypothetical protein